MALHGRDRRRLETDQTQALSHETRRSILALFTKDEGRSLAADDLLADLIAEDPARYEDANPGQIAYHRARLQDTELLPG